MIKSLVRAALAMASLLSASGCGLFDDGPDLTTNDVDRARLAQLAADPWLKPTESSAGGQDLDPRTGKAVRGFVQRGRTAREIDVSDQDDLYARALAEVNAAVASGWTLVTAWCQVQHPAQESPAEASASAPRPSVSDEPSGGEPAQEGGTRLFDACLVFFVKSPGDFEREQLATLCYTDYGYRAGDMCPVGYDFTGEGSPPRKAIMVSGLAPHHADRGWPKFVPVSLERTCLLDSLATTKSRENDHFPAWRGQWLDSSGHEHDPPSGVPGQNVRLPNNEFYPFDSSLETWKSMRGKQCPLISP